MTTRASVTINTQADRDKVARWAMQTAEGTIVEFRKKTRSHEQSAKMWAMLHEVSEQVEWYGTKMDAEDWKDVFTASLRHARVVPGIDKGTFVPLGMRTSNMTIDEMSNLIELVYAFGAEHGVTFKEPQETQNTDDSGPANEASSVAGEELPSSPQQDGGEVSVPSPASSPSSSSTPDEYRTHFIDFARKALTTAADMQMSQEARTEAIDGYVMSYREVLPESLWQKLSGVKMPALYVVTGQRTVEQARSFIARDLLECSTDEIGG